MNLNLSVSKSIEINAPLANVWEALITPEIIKKYLYGTNTTTNWEVGSTIVFEGEYEGTKYKDHGIILENVWHSKISYSYWSGFSGLEDKPENYSTVTYQLTDKGNNITELTWIQKGYASEENRNHSESGMDEFLKHIKTVIES